MNRAWVLFVLLGLNIALAGMAYHVLKRRTLGYPAPPMTDTAGAARTTSSPSGAHAPNQARGGTDRFGWRNLESSDLKAYIANLRAVNCPEETIQDIIVAAVDRLYRSREEALGLVRNALKPWEVAVAAGAKDLDQITKLRQLRLEKQALLRELLGIEVSADLPDLASRNSQEAFDAALEYLPVEKRGPAREIQDKYWDASYRLRQKVDGLYLPEDMEEFRKMRVERSEALARLLTPAEFDDLELRASSTSARLKNQLGAMEPTEAEFRAIFGSQRQFDDNFSTPGQLVGDHSQFLQSQQQAREQTDQAVRAALGDARYSEYQRAQDGLYRSVYQAARDAGIPRENAVQAYDSIQASRNQFAQWTAELNQTPGLTDQQRNQALGDFQKSQRDALRQLLGDTAFKQIEGRLPQFNLPPAAAQSQSGKHTMKLTPIASVLLVIAVAQAALVAHWGRNRSASESAPTASPALEQSSQGASDSTPSKAREAAAVDTSRFDWASVESTDFEQYIANLRAIGCPEQTIRDIIIADVNKLYAPREAPFMTSAVKTRGSLPWETQPNPSNATAAVDAKADFERRRQLRDIEREKAAVIKQLLGIDLPLGPLRAWRSRNYDRVEAALAALPPEKRERVREIQEVYWQASDTLNDQYSKEKGPAFTAEYQRINDERRNLMAQAMTPEELEDYEMRSSSVAQQLSGQLASIKPTEQEFRAIYSARKEMDDELRAAGLDPTAQLTPEQRAQREQAARDQIKEALGDERYTQYERSLDSAWQQLTKMQSRFGLEPEKIEEAYSLISEFRKQATDAAANAFLANAGAAPVNADVKGELEAQSQQALAQLTSILGEKAGLVMQARMDAMVPNPGKAVRYRGPTAPPVIRLENQP